jgi:hypothetical protein
LRICIILYYYAYNTIILIVPKVVEARKPSAKFFETALRDLAAVLGLGLGLPKVPDADELYLM